APPARRRAVAAPALAAPASARLGAADAWQCGVRHPARRRLVLVLRRLGAARAAVAALGAAAGAAPRALCRLARRRAPGRGARGLVVAPLALRRDRQAAGAAAAAVAARPSLRHGLAVAGHRRRDCGVDA